MSMNNSTSEHTRASNHMNSNLSDSKVLHDFNVNGNGDSAAYYEEEESAYVEHSLAIQVPHIVTSTYYSHTDYDNYDDNSISNIVITNGRSKPLPPIESSSKVLLFSKKILWLKILKNYFYFAEIKYSIED